MFQKNLAGLIVANEEISVFRVKFLGVSPKFPKIAKTFCRENFLE